jgi:hypothetical protein
MANNIDVKDASAATKTMKTTDNSSVHTPHQNVDAVIPGTGATNLGKAEDAAHASGDVGVMALAVRKDTAAASSGTTGDYEPLSTDATGQLRIKPEVKLEAATSGGTSNYHRKASADTNTAVVKASAGQLYGVDVFNFKAATVYLKIYDKASTPNLASDTPIMVIPWFQLWARSIEWTNGIAFTNGIAIAITAGLADNDTTALVANDCVLNLQYK